MDEKLNHNYTLTCDHAHRYILYTHSGSLNADSIGLTWVELLNMPEFVENRYNLLTDYSGAVYGGVIEDLERISEHLSQYKSILQGKKQAIIFNDPYSTALTVLFNSIVEKNIGFIVEVFSTREHAIDWLTISKR